MLELFYSPTCPYCRKVLDYFEDENIDFERKDVSDKENYNKLMQTGKIAQVPFLIDTDNNKQMYESDEIIKYVKGLKA